MKLLTLRNQAMEVSKLWQQQYPPGHLWGEDKDIKGRALQALDPVTATPEDFAKIIGSTGWCCPQKCDECGRRSWLTAQMGETPDYESSTAILCLNCLRAAVKALEAVEQP